MRELEKLVFALTLFICLSLFLELATQSPPVSSAANASSRDSQAVAQRVYLPLILNKSMAGATPPPSPTPMRGLKGITDPYAVFNIPQVPKPAYLVPFTDPVFGTKIIRIAGDAGTSFTALNGTGTWGADARQHYTDDEPWNADQSLIALQNSGSPDLVFLDGDTYQPKYIKCSNYDNYDDRWHPLPHYKNIRINVESDNPVLEWFDVVTCTQVRKWNLPFVAVGDVSQNPSTDGRWIALWDDSSAKGFVVDMESWPTQRLGPVYDFANCGLTNGCTVDRLSVTPGGHRIVVSYAGDKVRVFDIDPSTLAIRPHAEPANAPECTDDGQSPARGFVWDLGHTTLATDPFDNNNEVVIGQRRSWCSTLNGVTLGQTVMVRLSDGRVTSLTDPANEAHSYHNSGLAYSRPGWVYVSHYPDAGTRFDDEVIAVTLDGLQSVERFLHDHTDTSGCYRCEAHPAPSRDGQRVIFASSWTLDCGGGCGSQNNPQAYVMDAR